MRSGVFGERFIRLVRGVLLGIALAERFVDAGDARRIRPAGTGLFAGLEKIDRAELLRVAGLLPGHLAQHGLRPALHAAGEVRVERAVGAFIPDQLEKLFGRQRIGCGAAGAGLLVHLGSRDSLRIHHAAPDPLRLLFCKWLHGISLLRPIVCAAGPDCAVSQKIPHGNGKFARFSHRKILYFQYVCVKILFCEIFMYETFRQRRKGRQV